MLISVDEGEKVQKTLIFRKFLPTTDQEVAGSTPAGYASHSPPHGPHAWRRRLKASIRPQGATFSLRRKGCKTYDYSHNEEEDGPVTMITIPCPDQVLISLKEDADSFARDLRMTAAVKFYEMGRLSSGQAAALAGVSRVAFLRRSGEFGVPAVDLTAEELEDEAANA